MSGEPDIVARLRAKCAEDITWDEGDGNAEMAEAADEIERLRRDALTDQERSALRLFRDDNASMREAAVAWAAIDRLIGSL